MVVVIDRQEYHVGAFCGRGAKVMAFGVVSRTFKPHLGHGLLRTCWSLDISSYFFCLLVTEPCPRCYVDRSAEVRIWDISPKMIGPAGTIKPSQMTTRSWIYVLDAYGLNAPNQSSRIQDRKSSKDGFWFFKIQNTIIFQLCLNPRRSLTGKNGTNSGWSYYAQYQNSSIHRYRSARILPT